MIDRRSFLLSSALGALYPVFSNAAGLAPRLRLGPASPFAFDALIGEARALATRPHVPAARLPDAIVDAIDYEALGHVAYDSEFALFKDGPGRFPVTFFMPGKYARTPVRVHVVEGNPQAAREIVYDAAYFHMPADSPARKLPTGAGFAGFRVQESRLGDPRVLDWRRNDWVAFQGASYFRAIGGLYQYGLSARGVAIDTAVAGRSEEFPAFTRFYIQPAADAGADTITVHALLEGPGVTGAYRFVLRRDKDVVMDVEANLFLRRDVERLGLAPLTSMYWFSESLKATGVDWRPEIHDSDGLAVWTGAGERIWRPLNDPRAIAVSAFADNAPRGFGLMQRDRNFDHYLDGVHYERRPSLWVEPREGLGGGWGEGTVQLIEIPTDDEINDNIVLCWVPRARATAGSSYRLSYRLHWTAGEPFAPQVAHCVATRIGRGGQPGKPRPARVAKFVVEFLGGPLVDLPYGVLPEVILTVSSGSVSQVFAEAVPDGVAGHWRAVFDLSAATDPVELRLFLKAGDKTLTETWLYQYHPPAS